METRKSRSSKVQFGKTVNIHINEHHFSGELQLPPNAGSLIIFSLIGGGSPLSPGNKQIALWLEKAGFGTFHCNLLTDKENQNYKQNFDIELLTRRLKAITNWFRIHEEYNKLKIAYYSTSTGTAIALKAASELNEVIKAVASVGGRPDLAAEDLIKVSTPTLLVVGELDFEVIRLNRVALNMLTCPKQLVIVPGASHLFEEHGKLVEAGEAAIQWFLKYLTKTTKPCSPRY